MNLAEVEKIRPPTAQIIADAIADLYAQQQVVSREALSLVTGLKMSQVDDHVTRMVEDGKLRRLHRGVFAPIVQMPEPRPFSLTILEDGTAILELGDNTWRVWPRELRAMAASLAGFAGQYSSIQIGTDVNTLTSEFAAKLGQLERRVEAFVKTKAEPTPQ